MANQDFYVWNREAKDIVFGSSNNERLRIDSSGRLLIGTSDSRDNDVYLQLEGVGYQSSTMQITRNSNNADGGGLYIVKTRGTADGQSTIVQNGDELGYINFRGADGTDGNTNAATIQAFCDGAPGSNDMPGRLVFSTTSDGASSATQRMVISSNGDIVANFDGSSRTGQFKIADGNESIPGLTFWADGSGDTGIFRSGANTLNFTTGGTERLRIKSNGVVQLKDGILELGSTSGQDNYIYSTNAAGIIYQADENGHRFQTYSGSWQDRLKITDAGNVGITSTSPAARLDVFKNYNGLGAGNAAARIYGIDAGVAETGIRFVEKGTGDLHNTSDAYLMRGISNGSTKFVFKANGQVLIGRDSASHNSSTVEIRGGNETYVRVATNNTSGSAGIIFGSSDDHSTGGIYYNNSDDSLVLAGYNNDEKFRITSYGDVYSVNSAYNTYDNAATSVNTIVEANENRSGVYWLNFNGQKFRAYVKANWLQGRNWVLAAKYFDVQDMPSGSDLWTNDTYVNESDFNLYGGIFSKYPAWRYFPFDRLAMQMGNRIPPIMRFSSNQTLYGAFSGGQAVNGGGVTASSTYPAMSGTSVTYHSMSNFMGPDFYDVGGSEDRMQSYGLNKWANNSTQATAAQNRGSEHVHSGDRQDGGSLQYASLKGWGLTVEDSHPTINGIDSIARAGAWIGCPLDEGNSRPGDSSSNPGADSGFGFGFCTGNPGRTGTAGYAEWGRGTECVNTLPAYIWLSAD